MQRSSTAWEVFTPVTAQKTLDNHSDPLKRDTNQEEVDKLARAMERDEWDDNGESVKFTGDGIMTDGHKRMTAIAQLGDRLPRGELWLQVCRGVTYDSRDTVDTNQPRSAADFVKMHGLSVEGKSKDLAALAARVWLYRQGIPVRVWTGRERSPKPAPNELAKVIRSETLIGQAMKRGRDLRRHGKFGTISTNAMAYWLMSRVDDGSLEDVFWPALMTGETLNRTIVVCRDRLIRAGKMNTRGPEWLNADQMLYALVAAYNAFGQDKVLREADLLPKGGVVYSSNFIEPLRPLPGKANPRLFTAV